VAARLLTLRRLAGGIAAGVGYILSPLSWWNDLIVNVPLAMALAAALARWASVPLDEGFAIGYWATNAAGMILLLLGGSTALRGRAGWREALLSLAAATAYTLVAVLLLRLLA